MEKWGNQKQLSEIMGVNPAQVTKWKQKGFLQTVTRADGKIDLENAPKIIRSLSISKRPVKDSTPGGNLDYSIEKARTEYFKNKKLELEYLKEKGTLVKRKEIEKLFSSHIVNAKNSLLGLEGELRAKGIEEEVVKIVMEKIKETLRELGK